jgi:hypothetical protein
MRWRTVVASFGVALAVPAGASAAGGPVPPVQGGNGVGVAGSSIRFVARRAGRDTVVERMATHPRRVQSTIRLSGAWGVPGADYNGATTGLSGDGRTLVLAQITSSFPATTTRLLELGTRPLAVRKRIVLTGWTTIDAISPHGRWLYLIHFRSSNISKYEVLAYDMALGRLIKKPIVDPRDRGEAMTGIPVSRVMSPDGRWAYTLYFRPAGVPFVHALDTAGLRAVCIDLPSVRRAGNVSADRLRLGHGANVLQVITEGTVRAAINTHTFAVGPRAAPRAAGSSRAPSQEQRAGGGLPWVLVVVPIAVLLALGVGAWSLPKLRAT